MKKYLLLFCLLSFIFCICSNTLAQDLTGFQKLRGKVISSAPENEYSTHAYNAFDTNKKTSFMAQEINGWVGLDLGAGYSIRKVRVFPMNDRHNQFEGAMLQAADNPEFNNAVTLFSTNDGLVPNQFTVFDIQNQQSFRYVRCINSAHRVSLAELEFYTTESAQTFVYQQLTNLPTIYLETKGNFNFIDKTIYAENSKVLVVQNSTVQQFPAKIRGRGNSTWDFMDKKAFRIKFDSKQHFLGMPSNAKNWTLIACAVDKTFLRNGLAFEISKTLGFEYTPPCKFVDVVLDGFYYGTYMASDHIDVNDHRIEIDEMEMSDVDLPNLTGGYHLEIDAYAELENVWFRTNRNVPFSIKSPDKDVIVQAQKDYIRNHINELEDSLYDNVATVFNRFIDLESAVKYYILSELTGNCDSYWCIPCYKKRNDDHLYFGPVWDYDQAFLTNERVPRFFATLDTNHGVANDWFRRIMNTPAAQQAVQRIWNAVKRDNLKQILLDYLSENAVLLQQSQTLNFERWRSLNRKVWFEDALFGTYDEYIDFVAQFIEDRFAWFNELRIERKIILPNSARGNTPQQWQYTFDTPADDWYLPLFSDNDWETGNAPFGTEQGLQNTLWTSNQIFIRRYFEIDENMLDSIEKAYFTVWHDEDCQIYVNGTLALEREGYLTEYKTFEFDKTLLQAGINSIAVKCIQTLGGQLIDVGISAMLIPHEGTDTLPSKTTDYSVEKCTHYVLNNMLIINSLNDNDFVQLYTIDGCLLQSKKAVGDEVRFTLPSRGIFIARLPKKVIKIVN